MALDPVFGGIASGIGSIAGSWMTNKANADLNYQNNMANYMMGIENRQWQEHMRATAYQTAAADMKKAGLNPAMMYGGSGGPAAQPSSSVPTMQTAHLENAISPAVDRIVAALRLSNETELNRAVVDKTDQEASTAKSVENLNTVAAARELATLPWAARQAAATLFATQSSGKSLSASAGLTEAQTPGAKADSELKGYKTEDYREAGEGPMAQTAINVKRAAAFAKELAEQAKMDFARQNSAKAHNEAMEWKHERDAGYRKNYRGRLISPKDWGIEDLGSSRSIW